MAKAPAKEPVLHRELATVAAIVWFGLFVLTLLSLASYSSDDLVLFNTHHNETPANFIGWVGAYWAGGLFLGLGLSAYIIPGLFLAASIGLFMHSQWIWRWKLLWAAVLLISAACLLHLQPFIGWQWRGEVNTISPGGFIGKMIGEDLLSKLLLGKGGSTIVLTMVYVASIILLFGLNLKQIFWTAWELYKSYRKRKEDDLAQSDPIASLSAQEKAIKRRQQELEKELLKQGSVRAEPAPQPRIIDTTSVPNEKEKPTRKKAEPKPEPKPEPVAVAASASEPVVEKETPEPPPEPKITDNTRRAKPINKLAGAHASSAESQDFSSYQLPKLDILTANSPDKRPVTNREELLENAKKLVETLQDFGIEVTAGEITKGATITRYEVKPADGVRVDKITSLQRDISRVMKAERVNILAPIPGKDTVGIEVANTNKAPIVLRDLFEGAADLANEWKPDNTKIPLALGKDVYGKTLIADLAEMPHLLIAGTTGSGKSVCINCILMSFLYRFKPDELRLILVDPKQVELQVYNSVPHLVVPVVTDPKKVLLALRWVIKEMEDRYKILAKVGLRNITSFNNRPRTKQQDLLLETPTPKTTSPELEAEMGEDEEGEKMQVKVPRDDEIHIPDHLPYIVVVIDELADLMHTAPADVESAIARLTAKARAAGIHLILATQTPRREVITGVIKTNVPSRIAFQVPSALDSRVILDENGAENLLGKGDLLYLPPGSAKFVRGQGAFVSDDEVKAVVDFCAAQGEPQFHPEIHGKLNRSGGDEEVSSEDYELLVKSLEVVRQEKRASTSLLQRRLRLGYNRAAWVMDHFEGLGIVGPENGAKPREILVDLDTYELPSQ